MKKCKLFLLFFGFIIPALSFAQKKNLNEIMVIKDEIRVCDFIAKRYSDTCKVTLIIKDKGTQFIYLVEKNNHFKALVNPDISSLDSTSNKIDTVICIHYFLQQNIFNKKKVRSATPYSTIHFHLPFFHNETKKYYFTNSEFYLFDKKIECAITINRGVIVRMTGVKVDNEYLCQFYEKSPL